MCTRFRLRELDGYCVGKGSQANWAVVRGENADLVFRRAT
jgi:hypothetical protein